MPKEIQDKLDFLLQSLDTVEKHLLDNLKPLNKLKMNRRIY